MSTPTKTSHHRTPPRDVRGVARAGAVILALVTIVTSLSGQQPPLSAERQAELLEHVRAVHRKQDNVGLALVVMHRGDIVLEDYLGHAVVEHDVPVTADTRFLIMSITKAFTGAALSRAVSQGLVSLDEPIQGYINDYPTPGEGVITLRGLAAHLAGVRHENHPMRARLYVRHFKNATEAMEVYRDRTLAHVPGTEYSYSSGNYNLIAAVLEAVTGQRFQDFVRQEVLEPIGLKSTGHDDATAIIPNKARNYTSVDVWTYAPVEDFQEVPVFDYSFNLAGGGMYSTARDLAAFGNALLAPGVFSDAELSLMRTLLVDDEPASAWSAGWFVRTDDSGRARLSVNGAAVGIQAGLYVYPEFDLVVATLVNAWGRGAAGGEIVIDAPIRLAEDYLEGLASRP